MNESKSTSTDCLICSTEFEFEETKFPILCYTQKCHFNMCSACIRQTIEAASNNSSEVASDGNEYSLNALNQQCPSCRGKFGVPLVDVIILRESEKNKALKEKADSELSAKELRKKYHGEHSIQDIDDIHGGSETGSGSRLEAAEGRYRDGVLALNSNDSDDNGIGTYLPKSNTTDGVLKVDNSLDDDDSNENDNDGGDNGNDHEKHKKKMDLLDSMLFCGLHDTMTASERTYVKELLTVGSTMKLTQAAHILASIMDMNQKGGTPLMRQMRDKNKNLTQAQLLRKTRSEPVMINTNNHNKNVHMPKMSSNTGMTVLANNQADELQSEIMNRDKLRRLYPIPIRMPKAINLRLDFDIYSTNPPITFIDDEQSFLVLRDCDDVRSKLIQDAYSELKVNIFGSFVKKEPYNVAGVENILSGLQIFDDSVDTLPPSIKIPWRRVVVTSVKGNAVRSGLRAGDVITFVDGEPFEGNVEKLKFFFARKQECEYDMDMHGDDEAYPSCQIICNAEVGIAEALRVRQILAERTKE